MNQGKKYWLELFKFLSKIFIVCIPFFFIIFLLAGGLAVILEIITKAFGQTVLVILMSVFLIAFYFSAVLKKY